MSNFSMVFSGKLAEELVGIHLLRWIKLSALSTTGARFEVQCANHYTIEPHEKRCASVL